MLQAVSLIISGLLLIIVPHFLLPLNLVEGGRNALLVSNCSIWYHPEIYLGGAVILLGFISFACPRLCLLASIPAFLCLIQAGVLRPVFFYLPFKEPIVVLSHTISLRSHGYIVQFLVGLSVLVILAATYQQWPRFNRRIHKITPLKIALAGVRMKLFRSTALILALSLVIGAFFADIIMIGSIENTLEIGAGRLGADLMIVPAGQEGDGQTVLLSGSPSTFYMDAQVIDKLKTVSGVDKLSPQLYLRPLSLLVCCSMEDFLIIAYDPDTDFTIKPWVQYYLKDEQGDFDLVVGQGVKLYPGQSISLYGNLVTVRATLDPSGLGYFDNSVFIPISGARKMLVQLQRQKEAGTLHKRQELSDLSLTHLFNTNEDPQLVADIKPDAISSVFIKARDGVDVKELAASIVAKVPEVAVVKVKDSTISVKRQLVAMVDAFILPIIILLSMGVIILAIIFAMSANQRQREIGLLRAVGAKTRHVFKIFMFESMLISCAGGVFGVIFGTVMLLVFKNKIMVVLDLLYLWPTPLHITLILAATIGLSVLVGFLAGLAPALRASRMEPYQAIRYGEG